MSQLIPDNNVLLQFVPNVLKSVQGETLLFDKIAPHLEVAEAWLTTTFLSETVLAELPTRDANNKLLHYARMAGWQKPCFMPCRSWIWCLRPMALVLCQTPI